jgi:hypothetical protein
MPCEALQSPPSLPERISLASKEAGAASADSTARKLSQTAKRAHKERGNDELDTKEIIGAAAIHARGAALAQRRARLDQRAAFGKKSC